MAQQWCFKLDSSDSAHYFHLNLSGQPITCDILIHINTYYTYTDKILPTRFFLKIIFWDCRHRTTLATKVYQSNNSTIFKVKHLQPHLKWRRRLQHEIRTDWSFFFSAAVERSLRSWVWAMESGFVQWNMWRFIRFYHQDLRSPYF